jgi:hypothetical protein
VTRFELHEYLGRHAYVAYGRVRLWGTVVETRWGYRAEYAWPDEILEAYRVGLFGERVEDRKLLRALRERYGGGERTTNSGDRGA